MGDSRSPDLHNLLPGKSTTSGSYLATEPCSYNVPRFVLNSWPSESTRSLTTFRGTLPSILTPYPPSSGVFGPRTGGSKASPVAPSSVSDTMLATVLFLTTNPSTIRLASLRTPSSSLLTTHGDTRTISTVSTQSIIPTSNFSLMFCLMIV